MTQPESVRRWCASPVVCALILSGLFAVAALPAKAQTVFSQPVNISNSTGSNSTEQVAVDAAGDIDVVWSHQDSTPPFGSTVLFSRSTNGGASYSTPVTISHAGSVAGAGTVAVLPTGEMYVLWIDNSVGKNAVFFSSSADGTTFSSPRAISTANATLVSSGALVVDSSGNIDVVWDENSPGTDSVFFSQSTNNGTSFSTPVDLSGGLTSAESPQIKLGGGSVYVAWTASSSSGGGQDVFFSASSNGGGSFSSAANISNNASQFVEVLAPQLDADTAGDIDIVWAWLDQSGSSKGFMASHRRSSDGGISFGAAYTFTSGCSDCSMYPRVALDSAGGGINIVWGDFPLLTGGSAFPLFYARSVDEGATFGQEAIPETAPFSAPQLAVDSSNKIDVFFPQPDSSSQPEIIFTQSTDHGEDFSQPQSLASAQYLGYFNYPIIATDNLSNAYVAWSQTDNNGNSNIFLARSLNLSSLSVNSSVVLAGTSTKAQVTLSGPAPVGGAVVKLSSSNTNSATVPASVTIPAGRTSAAFRVTATLLGPTDTVQISASFGDSTKCVAVRVQGIPILGGLLPSVGKLSLAPNLP